MSAPTCLKLLCQPGTGLSSFSLGRAISVSAWMSGFSASLTGR